jgi:hypothetical protein
MDIDTDLDSLTGGYDISQLPFRGVAKRPRHVGAELESCQQRPVTLCSRPQDQTRYVLVTVADFQHLDRRWQLSRLRMAIHQSLTVERTRRDIVMVDVHVLLRVGIGRGRASRSYCPLSS